MEHRAVSKARIEWLKKLLRAPLRSKEEHARTQAALERTFFFLSATGGSDWLQQEWDDRVEAMVNVMHARALRIMDTYLASPPLQESTSPASAPYSAAADHAPKVDARPRETDHREQRDRVRTIIKRNHTGPQRLSTSPQANGTGSHRSASIRIKILEHNQKRHRPDDDLSPSKRICVPLETPISQPTDVASTLVTYPPPSTPLCRRPRPLALPGTAGSFLSRSTAAPTGPPSSTVQNGTAQSPSSTPIHILTQICKSQMNGYIDHCADAPVMHRCGKPIHLCKVWWTHERGNGPACPSGQGRGRTHLDNHGGKVIHERVTCKDVLKGKICPKINGGCEFAHDHEGYRRQIKNEKPSK
ncbi:unnamed protein product [Zymoseptoria tritici ST99CH_1A5]|uniref:Uncharacterized protein n=2 Tax=Zymoseptoria tritici TaxID=1047171 RepID=A0A1X7S921_ZYMT9|nr:unnamed protein product [Zymoseptoria tritici ST99CH_3D7]SMR64505.1 unnamed protein product [Zymoseptoria tritici ST99CH_3D1]SMY29846.1 unnamed protein product [Zymoseptoria tritici ST99CH_1A5]